VEVSAVELAQTASFEVRLSRPAQIELDGDPFGEAIGFSARAEPGALRIAVPPEEDPAAG
jgi:diacylglycerol kinase family enzyme